MFQLAEEPTIAASDVHFSTTFGRMGSFVDLLLPVRLTCYYLFVFFSCFLLLLLLSIIILWFGWFQNTLASNETDWVPMGLETSQRDPIPVMWALVRLKRKRFSAAS
jgi:hypothetical protein